MLLVPSKAFYYSNQSYFIYFILKEANASNVILGPKISAGDKADYFDELQVAGVVRKVFATRERFNRFHRHDQFA